MDEKREQELHTGSPAEAFNEGSSFENNEETASYTVIREKVKKRPVNIRKLVRRALFLLVGAVLFGIIAAFVFTRFTDLFTDPEDMIVPVEIGMDTLPGEAGQTAEESPESGKTPASEGQLPADDTDEESVSGTESEPDPESQAEDGTDAQPGTESDADDPTPTPEPQPTPQPTPTLTPEEESAERIEENTLLYSDLQNISEKQRHALVTVTGISAPEDWFDADAETQRETSGIIIANNGPGYLILTDYTVLSGSEEMLVTFYDGSIGSCSFLKADPITGLCILTIDSGEIGESTLAELEMATLGNSYYASQGDPVIAIGHPAGSADSIIFGQITSLSGKVSLMDMEFSLMSTNMQGTSVSSGAIVNMDGEIIGVILQHFAAEAGQNVITAIPISLLKQRIELLSNNEPIAYLGITGVDVSTAAADQFGMPVGIYVSDVQFDSPAFTAGIRRGDVITNIGSSKVLTMTALSSLINEGMAGQTQTITVMRLGASGYVEVEFETEVGAF